jgi:hypothetical protein
MEVDYPYIVLIISAIVGMINWFKPSPIYLKIFPVFLLATFLVETWGGWLSVRGKSNVLLYSVFHVALFNFYFYVMYSILQKTRARRIVLLIMLLVTFFAIANFIFFQKLNHFHSLTYSIGSLCLVGIASYYFLELFQLPHSVDLLHEPPFWISSALIFYFSCGFPIFGAVNIMPFLPKVLTNNLGTILGLLNLLLYSLFSIAFLCKTNTRLFTQK